jgi:hypothetical protein
MLFADNISKRATILDVVVPVVPIDSNRRLEPLVRLFKITLFEGFFENYVFY